MDNNGYGKKPFWQWVIIYLIIGGIIYAGIYYFFLAKKGGYNQSSSQTQPTIQPASLTSATVTLTSNGFSPAILTIKAGETVTWVNKSGETATVDSDPHPIHTNYAPLNLASFPDGGILTLTFDKPGTFGYHNHLNSSMRGTITVQ